MLQNIKSCKFKAKRLKLLHEAENSTASKVNLITVCAFTEENESCDGHKTGCHDVRVMCGCERLLGHCHVVAYWSKIKSTYTTSQKIGVSMFI